MKNKKLLALAVLAIVALAAVLASGVSAYLNDTDRHTDKINLAEGLKIQLLQPSFNADSLKNVRPRQMIAKDPKVRNDSDFDVFVYLEVSVPYVADLVVQDPLGKPVNGGAEGGPLYEYTPMAGWTALGEPSVDGEAGKVTSVYAWMEGGAMKPLKPGETTGALFEKVAVANFTQGTLEDTRQDITVSAYGLDASVLEDADPAAPKTPQAMWELLKNTYADRGE